MRVAEPELAAVQRRDRGGEAQPETRTRQSAACLEPAESLHRMLAVGLGYAGTVVGDAEQHGVALAPRLDQDFLGRSDRLRVDRPHHRLAIFDRVLDEVGERLAYQFAVGVERAGCGLHME